MAMEEQRRAERNKAKVLVVDDHPIVRQGLSQLINQQDDLAVCGEAEDIHQALEAIATAKPDIAIVDITLKNVDGIELIKNIRMRYGKLPVLVLSMHNESFYAERILRAGAKGYIMKQEATEKLIMAIRKVLNGEVYLSDKMLTALLQKLLQSPSKPGDSPIECLSDRELEVFRLIGQGLRTQGIADKLYMSKKTVESHRAHIKEKLKLKGAIELLQHATQWVQSAKLSLTQE